MELGHLPGTLTEVSIEREDTLKISKAHVGGLTKLLESRMK